MRLRIVCVVTSIFVCVGAGDSPIRASSGIAYSANEATATLSVIDTGLEMPATPVSRATH